MKGNGKLRMFTVNDIPISPCAILTLPPMAKGINAQEALAFAARLKQALRPCRCASPAVVASEFNLRYWGKRDHR